MGLAIDRLIWQRPVRLGCLCPCQLMWSEVVICMVTSGLARTTVEMWDCQAVLLGSFHTSYLGSRQGILSELGVSVFVFVCSGSCVFVVFPSRFRGLAWSLCPSHC